MNIISYINDQIVHGKNASISIFDLGLLRGYGVFDRLRTYQGQPFHLEDHLKRLQFSAAGIHLPLPKDIEEIKKIILHLLSSASHDESDIRIVVTGGTSWDGLGLPDKSSLIIIVSPLQALAPSKYQKGIIASTCVFTRSFPQCKTTQYLPAIVALEQGKKMGAQEVLYLNENNEILEGATSNFFAFIGNRLITTDGPQILSGFTREIALKLAKNQFSIEKRSLHLKELALVDEAFVTSSNREILPVVKIDQVIIGKGIPGKNTQFLLEKFREYTLSCDWPSLNLF